MALYSKLTSANVLHDLPSEILSAVCSHLPRKACYQVIQVSYRYNAIAEPFLYINIQVHVWDRAYEDVFHPLDKLLSNIRERPPLGFYVSALTLRVRDWKFNKYDDLLQRLPKIRHLELSPERLRRFHIHNKLRVGVNPRADFKNIASSNRSFDGDGV